MTQNKKTAIVTGASKGIGRAVAKYFSDQGYIVLLISRDKDALKEVVKALGAHHHYAARMWLTPHQ